MPWLQFELSYKGQNYGLFTAHIGGAYNLYNILAAVAAGVSLGMNVQQSALAACAYTPSNNRSEWKKVGEKMIWLDAYNANPSSMELALQSFAELKGPKVAMLGDMLELGEHSLVEHKNIAQLASELEIDAVYLCGPEFEHTTQLGLNKVKYYKNSEALTEWLMQHPISASYILVKGSRGVRMEKVLHAFS
jgi:UDP-N-acetylmuramoyl-tripeptide--D-alanyl-D-alanine ligase